MAAAVSAMENGKGVGVEARQADGTRVTLHANKAWILTAGGYANNPAMVQETNNSWPFIPNGAGTTNASGQTDDGNRLGGNTVADCFVFGKIAGETAAAISQTLMAW